MDFKSFYSEVVEWIADHTSCNLDDAVKEVDAAEDQVRRDFANGVSSETTAYNLCITRHIC